MQETFGIAAFRSRQQVIRFDSALRRAGIRSQVISTPRDVSMGCGLSVQFDLSDKSRVFEIYKQARPTNLIGFYRIVRDDHARPQISALM